MIRPKEVPKAFRQFQDNLQRDALMDVIYVPLLLVINSLLGIYAWIIIASVILQWLISFNILNPHSNFVRMVGEFLYRMTEPVLAKVRRFLPTVGVMDFSPFVVILIVWFLQGVIGRILVKLVMVGSV